MRTALLLIVVPIAVLIPCGDLASSQTAIGTAAHAPLFIAIDLTSQGVYAPYAISGGQMVGFGLVSDSPHAMLWMTATNVVDLHPRNGFSNGANGSYALGISGGQQVGWAWTVDLHIHALLWSGSAASVVDLNPGWLAGSQASSTSGEQQVGRGWGAARGELPHAVLWSGSAASAVDLHPNGFTYSQANGVSGGRQVGTAHRMTKEGDFEHALLWRGSAASVVDLTPPGFSQSGADGISGGQIVGWGDGHALLWNASAASVVDLHPSGFTDSEAHGTNGTEQVGNGYNQALGHHALLWRGSAASVVDLHTFLPSGFAESEALDIDLTGNILGDAWIWKGGGGSVDKDIHFFLWVPAR